MLQFPYLKRLISLAALAVGYQGLGHATASAQVAAPSDSGGPPNVVVEAPPSVARVERQSVLRRAVFVHIDSPSPVNLQRMGNDKRRPFYSICTSPCDAYVPADGEYRISGDGAWDSTQDGPIGSFDVAPSRRFSLPPDVTRDTIAVEPKSQTAFTGGIALTVLGGVALGLAGFWALAVTLGSDGGGPGMTGPAVTALGGGAAVVGILIAIHARSRVSQGGEATNHVVDSPALGLRTWRDAVPSVPRATASATLLRVSF